MLIPISKSAEILANLFFIDGWMNLQFTTSLTASVIFLPALSDDANCSNAFAYISSNWDAALACINLITRSGIKNPNIISNTENSMFLDKKKDITQRIIGAHINIFIYVLTFIGESALIRSSSFFL